MASYDDLITCKGGGAAIQAYQSTWSVNAATMVKNSDKRARSEDEYELSGSDFSAKPKRRKHRQLSRSRTLRRTRQASRELSLASKDSDYDDPRHRSEGMHYVPRRTHAPNTSLRSGRLTRSRASASQNHNIHSEDELVQDDNRNSDGPLLPMVLSDIVRPPRSAKRKKVRASMIIRRDDSDSSIEFEPARRSSRTNKNLKSMKDPEIDEYDVVEERQTTAPKYAAIKEVFRQLDSASPFRNVHSETCESCAESGGLKNPLVHCQGCSLPYHKTCIGVRAVREHRVTKVSSEDFVMQCKFCIQSYKRKDPRAPDHTLCQICKRSGLSCAEFSSKKTPKQEEKARLENGGEDPITNVDPCLINNAENVLFRCTNCKRAYHFEHLPALTAETIDDHDLKENRLEEYSMAGWNCKDCLDTHYKLHSLVAWRPLDQGAYLLGQTYQDYDEDNVEHLVRWSGRSHFHDTWMPGAWVFGIAPTIMRHAFYKRDSSTYPKMDKTTAIEEEWLLADVILNVKYRTRVITLSKVEDLKRIDEITSVFVKFQGLGYDEVVWDEPPPRDSGAPWEAFNAAYDEYLNGKYFVAVPDYKMRERIAIYRSLDFGKECELKSQPAQLKKGKLMEYQMEGVNFLLYNFHQQQNVILADEMGLGKTIQIVAFISALTHSKPCCWPFLVVVPNSTCPNWRRELKQWAPDLRVVTYHGGRAAQDLAYRHELYPDGPKGGMKAHVVIMSYEAAVNIKSVFYGVKWVGLIVDEGQRLKNDKTILYQSLRDMKIPCRILLTGTPLQNNKRELFTLLQFIDGNQNAEELDNRYAELTKDNLPELHNLIRPYFLRRTKAQVLKFLPPMAQIILPVTMTVVQEKLSKSIMARNPELIRAIISKSRLKAKERKNVAQMQRNLIEASPKLLLFEIMLPKLKERGHRVLIFSQYLQSLTILEDFLTSMDMPHARIDGSLSALEKQKRIDAFNAPQSPLFAMLLSTRAGGVGINLATADTVIIYDPDFNPHQDIQALSRAHRIGQKRKVLCFQLMTKNTVEEKIMQMGRKKMALDHALIESMDAKEEDGEDLESILKHGAAALFSDESSKDKITYDQASVDRLLDRSQIESTDTGNDGSAETQFSFARIWENDRGDLASGAESADRIQDVSQGVSTSIWENILKEREAEHERERAANQQIYGRGARRRGTQGIDYKSNRPKAAESGGSDIDVEDELYIDQNDMEDEDDSDDYGVRGETPMGTGMAKSSKGSQRKQEAVNGVVKQAPQQTPVAGDSMRRSRKDEPAPLRLDLPPITQPRTLPAQTMPTQHPMHTNAHIPSRPHSLAVASNSTNPPSSIARGPSAYSQQPTAAPHGSQKSTVPPPAVQLPNGTIVPTGLIGGGNPCAICSHQHSTKEPCLDLNSELSLRIAIDRLRAGGNDAMVQAARTFFTQRLLHITTYRQARQ
ncbi:PHD/FYVE-zinc-finger like domain-containing protein [Xylaria palmicola]|nr:PHD/FYVE-zinc-finger like domain-containing protein [Xylaria palmicola]